MKILKCSKTFLIALKSLLRSKETFFMCIHVFGGILVKKLKNLCINYSYLQSCLMSFLSQLINRSPCMITQLKTLSPRLNKIEQCCVAHIVNSCYPHWTLLLKLNQYSSMLVDDNWTMQAAQYCSIPFISILHQPDSFWAWSHSLFFVWSSP